jgi:uncharacterized protein YecE (DUF72 family)
MQIDGCDIHFGVAGWSYPDWKGTVYTGTIRDDLRYVAGYVDMIEINSPFYRPPSIRAVESWAQRTADLPGFFFSAKLHQDVTHRGVIDEGMIRAFHENLAPLAKTGRLSHLLAQFKYDFADSVPSRRHLIAIKNLFGDITELVVELRHSSWEKPEAMDFLQTLGVTVANLDYPEARNGFNLKECRIGTQGYFRLHGRNATAWFDKKAGRDEVYNYYYRRQEMDEIQSRAVSLAKSFKSLTIVANNHYGGKEVANILQLKAAMTGQKVRVPPGLLKCYSELKEIATAEDHDKESMLF